MRKPSAYLPFYGNDFFEAIAGYPDGVGLGYLRALWHYWNHTGCDGLPDDDEYLRRVCCCDIADWARTKAIVFDNRYLFRRENKVWHQPRCREEWVKSQALFTQRSKVGSAAAKKRWEDIPKAMPDALPRACHSESESESIKDP
ncbi:MAG: hypothetical protein QOF48_919 [Verrucomicrobiota bacterium]|jgi:uncharacterized protein YdaU (DUF1376 family)